MLFEVAILEVPTPKEIQDTGAVEKLVFGPKFVVAKDQQAAAMRAVMENIDAVKSINQERMQILVRPFA